LIPALFWNPSDVKFYFLITVFKACETETLNCEIKKKECAFLKPLITLMYDFLLPNALKSDVKKGK